MEKKLEALAHDCARATALALTNVIRAILRPEEVGECQREFYQVMRASISAYEEQRAKVVEAQPIVPSAN